MISPHGWMDPGNWPRLWKLGGLAWPGHSHADEYVAEWKRCGPKSTPYDFGWGYGADLGGLSDQPAARAGLTYPFKSLDGTVTFDRQKTGNRTFDYTTEGVAHYGLYADWFADLRDVGGPARRRTCGKAPRPIWRCGSAPTACPRRGARRRDAHSARAGSAASARRRLEDAPARRGAAAARDGAVWSWCVAGGGTDIAVLSGDGRVELVASTARGRSPAA